jgi:hypothetical protein
VASNGDEIEKVRRAESRRSKKPIDEDLIRERNIRATAFRVALEHYTDDKLRAFMQKYGILPGSDGWYAALKTWNELHERDRW